MRLLVLCNLTPYPPHGGVQLRVFNLLTRIAGRHEVTLACHTWGAEDLEGAAWLNRNGIRTITAPLVAANWRHVLPALAGAVGAGRPPELVQYQSPLLRALIATERFDLMQVEETLLAPYAASLPVGARTRTLLVFHNVHFVQELRIAGLEPRRRDRAWRRLNARMMRAYEPAEAARFDARIAVSQADRSLLIAAAPDLDVEVLPNGVDTQALQPMPPPQVRRSLIFVGSLNYRPCADAVIWLVRTILPILRRRFPDLDLWIVGKSPPPEVEALAGPGIFVTGAVPDVSPYYRRSAVAVVPLRAGGGSRLKILEAMAIGRPVVSTTVGAEGLEVTSGEDIILADEAQAFADAVMALLSNEALWHSIAVNGRRFVEKGHDWDMLAHRQVAIYDEILGGS